MALKQETVLFREGYDIGIGVTMATGSPVALGVRGQITPPQVGDGAVAEFRFRRLESTTDLQAALNIEADVEAGVGLFGGSASFRFSRECRIQSSSLAVMVKAEEQFAFQSVDEPVLSQAAGELTKNGKTAQFAQQFGEYFVRGIRTGGRFIGVVRIDTNSEASKIAVDGALSGSYGAFVTADVKATIRETLAKAQARAEAFVLAEGGKVTTRPTSIANDPVELLTKLFAAMDEWTATVRAEPRAYAATIAPYFVALGPQPPDPVALERQRDVLIRCAKLRTQTIDKLNLVDYILDPRHTSEFQIIAPPEGPDLPALQAALAGDLDVIADAASFSIDNVAEACDPETFMRTKRNVADFRLTVLPANMPKHTGSATPVVQLASMPDIRAVLQVGGFRTAAELETMSTEDQRNTLITEMVGRTNQLDPPYQSFDDRELAGAGAVLVFLRNAKIINDAVIKDATADGLRNGIIAHIARKTGLPVPDLQAMQNLALVALALKVTV